MPPSRQKLQRLQQPLADLYTHYNDPRWIHPDPLAPVRTFSSPQDQEIAGLIAASLAFGNVKQILRSIDVVFALLPNPHDDLLRLAPHELDELLQTFRHRYTTGADLADLLHGARRILQHHGSLGARFAQLIEPNDTTVVPALTHFVAELRAGSPLPKNYLLAEPARGSACKRWFMYLRWMVRRDNVDLGIWPGIPPRLLVIPMDTHMGRIARLIGLTQRKQSDLRAAIEVTEAFRRIDHEDPVRFDFCLTRLGIRDDADFDSFLAQCRIRR